MTWVRLDEDFAAHPKLAIVGPLGLAMQVAALCYCNRYLTDGFVPRAKAATLLDFEGIGLIPSGEALVGVGEDASWRRVVAALVEIGLWDDVPGGYMIHDYLEFQPSKEAVLAERAQKRAAGQAGGLARAQALAKARGKAGAKAGAIEKGLNKPNVAGAKAGAQAEPLAESKPVPVPVTEPEAKSKAGKSLLSADRSETTENGLPIDKELLTTEILRLIGKAADEGTPFQIRTLADRVPASSLVKVRESLQSRKPKDRAAYAVGALQSEYAELANRR